MLTCPASVVVWGTARAATAPGSPPGPFNERSVGNWRTIPMVFVEPACIYHTMRWRRAQSAIRIVTYVRCYETAPKA